MHTRSSVTLRVVAALSVLTAGLLAPTVPSSADPSAGPVAATPRAAGHSPASDPFYRYAGRRPLARVPAGTVLKKRTVNYHVAGLPLPLRTTQVLYRSINELGRPTVNVTSIIRPKQSGATTRVVSYQSFYDSLNPADEPSAAIAGGVGLGDGIAYAETALFIPLLLAGDTIVIPDTEGQTADFGAGREYGTTTLDSLRALFHLKGLGLSKATKIGMLGYSGGAIATEWAAELAPSYAPEVSKHIVGSAFGGVFVDPVHNLHYTDGSLVWSGVVPQALVGLARAFHIDLDPYLNAKGRRITRSLAHASIISALGSHPGLTFADLAKPRYQRPENIRVLVKLANTLIMSTGGTPAAPLFIGQGAGGEEEGTKGNKPGIGKGDGVMVAGDVRTLARTYCQRGVRVKYQQYAALSHIGSAAVFLPGAYTWLTQRLEGKRAPSSCGSIPAGNSIAPARYVPVR